MQPFLLYKVIQTKVYHTVLFFLSDSDIVAINQASFTVAMTMAGSVNESFFIDIVSDDVLEDDEMFNITLSSTQDRIDFTESTTTITILNDDSELLNDM